MTERYDALLEQISGLRFQLKASEEEVGRLRGALSDAQHFWKVDDIDNMEIALYKHGHFKQSESQTKKEGE